MYGICDNIPYINNRKENMFYIKYFAKKHAKFITRKGQYDKPDGTKGKSFVSKEGKPCLIYWDLDEHGWRNATGKVQIIT